MKKYKFKFFAILLMSVILISCDKEDITVNSTTSDTKQGILTFKTSEEFNETLAKVNVMSETDRKNWEAEKGFKSFGTVCDEFYKTINPKSFKDKSEVVSFIEKNNNLIEFYFDKDGETYCVTKEFQNAERYLLNKDKMYVIGTNVYKKFDEKLIATNITNIDEMYSAKKISDIDTNLNVEQSAPKQKVSSANTTEAEASGTCVIGTNIWNKDTYRVKAWIKTELVSNVSFYTTLKVNSHSLALGIWWYIDAPVTYSFSYTVSDSNNNIRWASTSNTVWITSSNSSLLWFRQDYNINNASNPYFTKYYCNVVNTITDDDGTGHCTANMSK